ncbi:DUF6086 family protein [Actinomycetota bacterium Odt1-20B]
MGITVSQYFGVGDDTLWNPSNTVARLFLRQVAVFEAELGLPSGIGPIENDECDIDPDVLGEFARTLLAHYRRTQHPVLAALCEGFLATLLVLAERAGIDVSGTAAGKDNTSGPGAAAHRLHTTMEAVGPAMAR